MSGEHLCGLGGHRRPHGDPDDGRSQRLGQSSVKTNVQEQVWSSEQKGGHSVLGEAGRGRGGKMGPETQQVLAHIYLRGNAKFRFFSR